MRIRFRIVIFSVGLIVFLASLASAQNNADRIKTIQTNLNNAKKAYEQLPDHVKKAAAAQRRVAHLADAVNRMASRLAKTSPGQQWSDDRNNEAPDENGLVRVNNPARDFRFTQFAGYTQDETTIARCGDNVVVGFNDTGSVLETLANGTAGISLSGVASSHDGGESFRDLGSVPPGGNGTNVFNADVLAGDPSVACSDPSNFYYVQTYFRFDPTIGGVGGFVNEIAISNSHDGGRTWGDPATAVTSGLDPDGFPTDVLGFAQVAVDPSNRKRTYVAYTRFRGTGDLCQIASTIEVVASTDGGKTFGPPVIMDSACLGDIDLDDVGTRLAVSSKGTVYVAWESEFTIPGFIGFQAQSLEVGSFTPGSAPTPPVVVGTISCTNLFTGLFCPSPVTPGTETNVLPFLLDTTDMQGIFLNFRDFDLAVDKSGGPTDGSVYVAWTTALGNALAPEAADISTDHFGFYAFTDIFFSRSADGQNFSPPSQLNSDLQPLDSRGHDHFQPTLAVDKTGKVAACWYDRRNDPQNYQFERFCSESKNAGATWAEFRVNGTLSTPSTMQDLIALLDEMGLYDGLTTDFTGHDPGFIGSFQKTSSGFNPDVVAIRFR